MFNLEKIHMEGLVESALIHWVWKLSLTSLKEKGWTNWRIDDFNGFIWSQQKIEAAGQTVTSESGDRGEQSEAEMKISLPEKQAAGAITQ